MKTNYLNSQTPEERANEPNSTTIADNFIKIDPKDIQTLIHLLEGDCERR